MNRPLRRLVVILGDQLDRDSAALDDFDPGQDRIWMAEVSDEATQVWSHKARIALFLAAMRAFRNELLQRGWPLRYLQLEAHEHASLGAALADSIAQLTPQQLVWVRPGEWRVRSELQAVAARAKLPVDERADRHFLVSASDFASWAKGRSQPRMEHFYRWMRRRTGILMEHGQPRGGRWNYDAHNRGSFGRRGPGMLSAPRAFAPDHCTEAVLHLVQQRFPEHPGSLDEFDWPLTPVQAQQALQDFIEQRLPAFGLYQDAMWTDQPWLYHSRLSAAMNLKLLHPRQVIDAALESLRAGQAPIEAVEGFVRQILGWREFVRGLYWLDMPQWQHCNELDAQQPLPAMYWHGKTAMRCMADSLRQVLRFGYGHHIQRLMVTGLFAQLLGVRPSEIHHWYLAMYVDAVEWVELPNVLGMSQFADGGRLASKPYVASGRYIQKMSNYCVGCRFDPGKSVGEDACPFTTLYWDFLLRHQQRFARHPRAGLQWRSIERLDEQQRRKVAVQAQALRERLASGVAEASS